MKFRKVVIVLFAVFITLIVFFLLSIRISPPEQDLSAINPSLLRTQHGDVYKYGPNWLKKERPGIWYMYVEGDDFERGNAMGILTKELAQKQEDYFVNEINSKVPSQFYQFFLKLFIGWFNRDLDKHIPLEYQKEIYGVSLSASEKYTYIGPAYQRLLNYHAAHDIGHALQNMHLVACTALGAWDQYAEDSSMYIGRNFDFYVGDDFAKDKIIAFVNPKHGNKFMMVTWGGMIGVLSGMNIHGLTVTLNADKSGIPSHSGTPVSIIAREILQYASTIDEAFAIAKKHTCFVSESFMIGSAKDQKIAVIEKTPDTTAMYYSTDKRIVCANHYQSKELNQTKLNIEDINDSTSIYRQQRVEELLNDTPKMNEKKMASILRNQQGLRNKAIGMGNPKAINQLIAHHSIIFNPYKKLVWISTSPFQLGDYLAVDLEHIFKAGNDPGLLNSNSTHNFDIPADSFLISSSWKDFLFYKTTAAKINSFVGNEKKEFIFSTDEINKFVASNPNYYNVYKLLGDYFQKKENSDVALQYYNIALSKELPSVADRQDIKNKVSEIQKNKDSVK
jgi:isopenicillin-N N-acyltransferase-like protein